MVDNRMSCPKSPLNVLIVHNVEDLTRARRSTLDYIYAFGRYAPGHNYHYHRIYLPVPVVVRQLEWDAVIFDSTALGFVTMRPRDRVQAIRDRWRFLRQSPAVKLAFPQDDASHGAILDQFFAWLSVDAVYTVRPEKQDLIYPISSRRAEFRPTLSGFIDDRSLAQLQQFARPFEHRSWQIGQRVTMYPAWGGRLARVKGLAALTIKEECQRRGIPENISVGPSDVFLGDDWYRFLGNCRFVVGAEGGHSIWDPYGVVQDQVNAYVADHPDATFEAIEEECFPGLDCRFVFPGIGPRIFEAAVMGCGQILVEGEYRGLLQPGRHYIPLKRDFSNLAEVFDALRQLERIAMLRQAMLRDLVESPRFRFSTLVEDVFSFIDAHRRATASPRSAEEFAGQMSVYPEQLAALTFALGREQERLAGEPLRMWARLLLSGQIDDAELVARLVETNEPPDHGKPFEIDDAGPAANPVETNEAQNRDPEELPKIDDSEFAASCVETHEAPLEESSQIDNDELAPSLVEMDELLSPEPEKRTLPIEAASISGLETSLAEAGPQLANSGRFFPVEGWWASISRYSRDVRTPMINLKAAMAGLLRCR
jgi:hypothetical protein